MRALQHKIISLILAESLGAFCGTLGFREPQLSNAAIEILCSYKLFLPTLCRKEKWIEITFLVFVPFTLIAMLNKMLYSGKKPLWSKLTNLFLLLRYYSCFPMIPLLAKKKKKGLIRTKL